MCDRGRIPRTRIRLSTIFTNKNKDKNIIETNEETCVTVRF